MKPNNILIDDQKLLDQGFLLSCKAVGRTLGAEGRLALLDNNDQLPKLTKDGVSIIRHIRFPNKTMNFGALQAIAGALRTLQLCGDATSTTCVMMMGYMKNIKRKYFNKAVERGIYAGVEEVYEHLDNLAKPVTEDDLLRIARVACNNEETLALTLIDAFNYAGEEGVVSYIVKEDKEFTEFIPRDGMFLDTHGYASAFFINKEDKQACFEAENVAVICSATWEFSQHIINQIQLFYQGKERSTPLIVFIERSNSDMTEKLVSIKEIGYNLCLVATSGYDEFESETLLNDVANFTGAKVYNPRNPESQVVFGIADKVTVTLENTSLIVNEVPSVFKETLDRLEKAEKPDVRRIKRLKTRAAIIEVGGLNLQNSVEVGDRIDDGIGAIKSAKKSGFLTGGGAGLVYISGLMKESFKSKEEQRGYNLVKTILKQPMLTILENSNRKQPKFFEFWKKDYLGEAMKKYGKGYNAITDEITDLLEEGIIDSKYSLKIALESATERAIQQLSTSIIIHWPESQTLD